MDFVRTPDDRFADLVDFPYEPSYVEVDGLRMAYVDEGPADGPVMLLLHGEPTWSYLYRRMIPPLAEAGYRCIAPDLIGFGRSDKPTDPAAYTYANYITWTTAFMDAIDLPAATLFAQDWGGLIGLRLVTASPDRFTRVAVGNTGLPVGTGAGPGFDAWLAASQQIDYTHTSRLMKRAVTARELSEAELAAYDAPFPDESHTVGAKVFPTLVPITPEHAQVEENREAWKVLAAWDKPFLTLWGTDDPVLGHLAGEFIKRIPGAAGQLHQEFSPGGHFIQDDRGEDLAAALIEWMTLSA